MKKQLTAITLIASLAVFSAPAFAVERDMKDSGEKAGSDSFSFGVEREMKESGEKGGTEDINIGVGELQETSVTGGGGAGKATFKEFSVTKKTDASSAD